MQLTTSSASSAASFFGPARNVCSCFNLLCVFALVDADESRHFSSTHVGTTEIMEEERQKRELIKSVDDWFILLDVPPGKTFYLPPGISKIPNTVFLYFVLFFSLIK